VFKSPWAVDLGRFDVRHQTETASTVLCKGTPNGGQVFLRRSNPTDAFLENMMDMNSGVLNGTDAIADALTRSGAAACTLDPRYFIGHCAPSHFDWFPARDVIVYHANCAAREEKRTLLTHFLEIMTTQAGGDSDVTIAQAD
jgi:hypothetical protein